MTSRNKSKDSDEKQELFSQEEDTAIPSEENTEQPKRTRTRRSPATKTGTTTRKARTKKWKYLPIAEQYKNYFLGLFAAILLTRIIANILLPNAVWDSFEYIERINFIRSEMQGGTFNLGDLFGLWVPMYQFICAVIEYIFGSSGTATLTVPKFITMLFGVVLCFQITKLTYEITKNDIAALIAGALAVINPTLLVYSTTALTDVPYATMIMGTILLANKKKWYWASVLMAMAALTRTDAWMLMPVLGFIIHYLESNIKKTAICFAIMFSAIILWFCIAYSYSGNFFYFFEYRNTYIKSRMEFNPQALEINAKNIIKNFSTLYQPLIPFLIIVILGGIYNSFSVKWNVKNFLNFAKKQKTLSVFIPASVFTFLVGYYVMVYFSKQQNEFFSRYGITMLSLSIPLSIYFILKFLNISRFSWAIVVSVGIVSIFSIKSQINDEIGFRWSLPKYQKVADYVKDYSIKNPNKAIYCDNPLIRVNSTIDRKKFLTSKQILKEGAVTRQNIDSMILSKNIGLMVVTNFESNLINNLKPELIKTEGSKDIYKFIKLFDWEEQKHVPNYVYEIVALKAPEKRTNRQPKP